MNDLATWYFNGFDWLCIFSSHFELLSGIPQTLAILQAQSDVSWLETWNKELPGLLGGLQHMGKNNGQCYLFIYLLIYLFIHLFIYPFIHLFIYLFIYFCLFIYLFNCLYTYIVTYCTVQFSNLPIWGDMRRRMRICEQFVCAQG